MQYQRDQRVEKQQYQDSEPSHAVEIIRKLTLQLDNAAAKNQSLQEELLGLQEKQFQQMLDPRYAPPEDSVIVQELSDLQHKITRIGKDHVAAHVKCLDKRSEKDLSGLHRELQNVALTYDSIPKMIEELGKSSVLGKVYFTALLSWHVHRDVLSNPFFFMKDQTATSNWYEALFDVDGLARTGMCQHSAVLYSGLNSYTVDGERATLWRSQTLRYFMPEGQSEQALRVRERTIGSMHRASGVAARDFLSSPAMSLVVGKDREHFDELEGRVTAVYVQAAEFAMRLWRQGVPLRITSLSDLTAIKFQVDSQEVKAHPLHKLDDPTDRSLHGRPICIMMHPLVASAETKEGAQTDNRVFIKAVVVLGEIA